MGTEKDGKKARIAEAARELFRERGFSEVSFRDIARAAGVSASAISYYFGNKENLYRALFPEGDAAAPDSRAEILRAAQRLFAESGYAKVSIRDIAEAAGVSSSAISYYFGGKAALYREVLEQGTSLISEFMERAQKGNAAPDAILRLYGDFLMRCGEENPEVMRLIFRELMEGSDVFSSFVRERLKQMIDVQRKAFLEGQGTGVYRQDARAEIVSMAWAGMVLFYHLAHGIMADLAENGEPTPEEYMESVWKILSGGIGSATRI